VLDAQLAACERAVCGGGWVGSEASGFTKEKLIEAFRKKMIAEHNYNDAKELQLGSSHLENFLEIFHAAVRYLADVLVNGREEGAYTQDVINECREAAELRFNGVSPGSTEGLSKK
jgi:hypothetical protein